MKVKIEETEYKVSPISPEYGDALGQYSELSKKLRESKASLKEREPLRKELTEVIDAILADTVSPKPKKEHRMQLLQTAINLSNKAVEEADCFRKPK